MNFKGMSVSDRIESLYNSWHPLMGLSSILQRCYMVPGVAKALDLAIATLFFSSPDLNLGPEKWLILLMVRNSAIIPLILTCGAMLAEMFLVASTLHQYGFAEWMGYAAFVATFATINALKPQRQVICAVSIALASVVLFVLWKWPSFPPPRAIAIAIATWIALSLGGIVWLQLRNVRTKIKPS